MADDDSTAGAIPGDGLLLPGPLAHTLDARAKRRLGLRVVARILAVTAFLLVIYFTAPIGRDPNVTGAVILVVGLVGFVGALWYQIKRIIDSPMPQLRAIEALGTAVTLFIVIFASVYVLMSASDGASFSEPVSKVAGLYFTVTVLATVGFGDITPVTDTARLVVTLQMVIDLIIIGVVVKLILGASRIGVERRRAEAAGQVDADGPGAGGPGAGGPDAGGSS